MSHQVCYLLRWRFIWRQLLDSKDYGTSEYQWPQVYKIFIRYLVFASRAFWGLSCNIDVNWQTKKSQKARTDVNLQKGVSKFKVFIAWKHWSREMGWQAICFWLSQLSWPTVRINWDPPMEGLVWPCFSQGSRVLFGVFKIAKLLRWQDFYRTFQASMVAERVWDCSIARKSNHLFLIAWSTNPHFWLLQGLSAFKRNQPSFRVQGLSSSKKNQPFFEKIVATTSSILWTARAIDWLQGHLLF